MGTEGLSLLLVLGLVFLIGTFVAVSRLPKHLKLLICVALLLRVVGSIIRYVTTIEWYGRGDALQYYEFGVRYAESFSRLDFSPLSSSEEWRGGRWWGTQFLRHAAGFVLTITGPTLLGAFIVFSLLAFLGLAGFAAAFRRSYPEVPLSRYVRWIWLFPSLWFWPSSIGKEALMLMGIGLCVAGFVGRKGRINWLLLACGMFFVFAIRPQVAAVVFFSMTAAHWLCMGGRWTPMRALQGLAILLVGLGGIWYSMSYVGVEGFDVEGVQSYMEGDRSRRVGGQSAIEAVDVRLAGVPLALVNILFRPFLWEARNPMVLFSALEIAALWVIAWSRRRNLVRALRRWRSDRLVGMAISFVLVYSIALGMMVVNLGIVARQRIFLFPFLFLLFEAAPRVQRARQRVAVPLAQQPHRIAPSPQELA